MTLPPILGGPQPPPGPNGPPGTPPGTGGTTTSGGGSFPGFPPGGGVGAGSPTAGVSGVNTQAVYSSLQGSSVLLNPWLASQLYQVFADPVRNERPGLLHFAVASGADPYGGYEIFGLKPGLGRILIFALSGIVLVAFSIAIARWGKRARARLLASALLAPAAVAGLMTASSVMSEGMSHTAAPVAHIAAQPALAAATAASRAVATTATSATPADPWHQLLAIESTVNLQHDALASVEARITSLSAAISALAQSGQGTHAADLTDRLAELLTQRAAIAGAYQQSLQDEYSFFVAAAQTPATAQSLTAAAAASNPTVQQAVAYDIQVALTQLTQEAAITSAEGSHAFNGSFTPPPGGITFHAPVGGVVSQGFGPTNFSLEPPLTYDGVFYRHFHTGLDISTARGTPLGAAADGVVVLATSSVNSAGQYVGYGNYVVINHGNGFYTLYGHLDKILVAPGQVVKQGQVIGLLGSTGWSTGPHVHFEIRFNGKPVDPAPYLAGRTG